MTEVGSKKPSLAYLWGFKLAFVYVTLATWPGALKQ